MSDNPSQPDAHEVNGGRGIAGAATRGLAVTGVAQGIKFVVQFTSSIIMARLLLPTDFGLVAMAGPIVAFVQLVADLGLTQATVQRERIDQHELSFVFWISIAASVTVGSLTMACAPLAALFYHEPKVTAILLVMGPLVMIGGLYGQHMALLNRALRFGALAKIEVVSVALGSVLGIGAAFLGASYWSILVAQATTTMLALMMAWSITRWVPSRPSRPPSARLLLNYGADVTTFNFANFFARNLDNILIGRFAGGAALGIYDRAYKLLLFPLAQITAPVSKVALPVLSRCLRDPDQYRAAYFEFLNIVIVVTFPLVLFAGIHRAALVDLLLGPQWLEVVPIFGVLAIGGLFAPIGNSTGWLLNSQGRTRELRNYGLISALAFITAFIVGLRWGPLGVARCYILVGVVQGPMLWWATTRYGPVSLHALLRNLVPSVIAALIVAGVNWSVATQLRAYWGILAALLLLNYVMFWTLLWLLPNGRSVVAPILLKLRHLTRELITASSSPGR